MGSGLITTSATGKTLTIASNQIATGSILGRVTAGTGNIETLTGTQATTLLDVFTSTLKGLAPASGGGTTNFLRADGTWAAAGGSMAIGGSITSATAGSVLFAGTSGVLQQDNANFFWDDTNNRLGIGTNVPSYILHAKRDANTSTELAIENLTAGGAAASIFRFITNAGFSAIGMNSSSDSGVGSNRIYLYSGTGVSGIALRASQTGQNIKMYTNGDAAGNLRMSIESNGNVLIGTSTDAGFKLDVNGEARVNVLNLKNDSSIAKSTSATYKYLNGFNFYNTSSGDINFLNDFITGKINFGAGQTATAQMTLNANGTLTLSNVGINRSGTSGTASIAIGTGTGATASGSSSIAIGNQVSASGTNSIAIGERASAAATSAISIGYFVFGAANTFVCGSYHANITNVYFGNGYQADQFSTTAGVSYTINGSGGFGSNQNGGNITIAGGKGTGTGTSGDVIFSTATTTTSGSTLQTLTERWWIKGQNGALSNVASPNASAITQINSTTQGFLPPRMTTTEKNAIATPAAGLIVYDTTLNKLCVYTTAWETITSL